jgi:2-(1,2-epoxy-1,2-dihydrophenyl)acetyl-CoA isomerase
MKNFITTRPSDNPGIMIEELVTAVNRVLLAIRKLKKPVIAAVNGLCSGGGTGLAMACDILFAAENAKIHLPNVRIGLVPDGGNSFFLVQKLGRHKAAELYFTAEPLDAHEACQLGLLRKVVQNEELVAETERFAEKISNGPGVAMGMAKSMFDMAASNNLETQLEVEKEAVISCGDTGEFKEGITAFIEKREPDF